MTLNDLIIRCDNIKNCLSSGDIPIIFNDKHYKRQEAQVILTLKENKHKQLVIEVEIDAVYPEHFNDFYPDEDFLPI